MTEQLSSSSMIMLGKNECNMPPTTLPSKVHILLQLQSLQSLIQGAIVTTGTTTSVVDVTVTMSADSEEKQQPL